MSARLSSRVIVTIASAIALESCSFAPTHASQSAFVSFDGARASGAPSELVRHGRVSFPPGMSFAPGTLRVVNSLGSHELASDGSFAIVAYRGGPQFTLVTSEAGDPILAGFVGPARTTINTVSTAKLLVFFAAGSYALPQPYRSRAIDALAAAPGFDRVERALDATLRADRTALGRRTDSDDSFSAAIDRFVTTNRSPSRVLARFATIPTRRVTVQHLLRRFLVPLASAVLVPIDSPSIDAMASAVASPAPVDELADLVMRRVPAIATFVDEGQTGDALVAAYTSIADSDAARVALFAMVRGGHDEPAHRADGEALYDTASSIFATWNVFGSAFTTVPTTVVSERTLPAR